MMTTDSKHPWRLKIFPSSRYDHKLCERTKKKKKSTLRVERNGEGCKHIANDDTGLISYIYIYVYVYVYYMIRSQKSISFS